MEATLSDPQTGQSLWSFTLDILVGVISLLATALGAMALHIVNGFKADQTELSERVDSLNKERKQDLDDACVRIVALEKDRSAIATLTEQVRNLAENFAAYQVRMEAHHTENRESAQKDRDETMRWRTDVMGPVIQKLVTDTELNKQRILELENARSGPRGRRPRT
jgi:hypothetical protein